MIVSGIAGAIYVNGYIQAKRKRGSLLGLGGKRLVFGTTLYIVEITGAIMLAFGQTVGLYIAAVTMTVLLAYSISGAWLLLVGVYRERFEKSSSR